MTEIQPRQEHVDHIWQSLANLDTTWTTNEPLPDAPQTIDDEALLERARNAANGDKFTALWNGHWQFYFDSQSEADCSLFDAFMFNSPGGIPNREQVKRLFLASALGQRAKAERSDYLDRTMERAWRSRQERDAADIAATEAARAAFEALASSPVPTTGSAPAASVGASRFLGATADEWESAALPDCIVEGHYYADVALLIGPGGVSKSTLFLDQAVSIVLGIPVYGQRVLRPGPVAILTAEDGLATMRYRLRQICRSRNLTPEQTAYVRANIRIADVVGEGVRLTRVARDIVQPDYALLSGICADLRSFNPTVIAIDPAVAFGVGESRVNDAEQALKEAGRCIVRALNCCVVFIHHTGKENARSRQADQYAGRGGSAFADGSRMSHVLHAMTADEFHKATGKTLSHGETALKLSRPKLSYGPESGALVVRRRGFAFEYVPTGKGDPSARLLANCETVLNAIRIKVGAGLFPTQNSLKADNEALGMTTAEVTAAVAMLLETDKVERRKPNVITHGGNKSTYLHPLGDFPIWPPPDQQEPGTS